MKKIFSTFLVMILSIILVGCSNKGIKKDINATLIYPDGLPGIAISEIISNNKEIANIKMEYSLQKTPDLLVAELMKGEANLAIVPSNLALQSYKKGLDYKVAATIGWGSLYLVTTENIASIEEIKGEEIYNTGKGLTPDIVFKKILNSNNISEDEVNLSYVGAATELAPMIASGKVKYAVLPEPSLSTVMAKNTDIKILLDLNEEWKKINNVDKGYPQSTLLIKTEFYNKIKDNDLYEKLINKFSEGEQWVIDNPEEAAEKCEVLGISVNKEVINKSLKNSNLNFTPIKNSIEEYNTYFKAIDLENKGDNEVYDSLFIKE